MVTRLFDFVVKFILYFVGIFRSAEKFQVVPPQRDIILNLGNLLPDNLFFLENLTIGHRIIAQIIELIFEGDLPFFIFGYTRNRINKPVYRFMISITDVVDVLTWHKPNRTEFVLQITQNIG